MESGRAKKSLSLMARHGGELELKLPLDSPISSDMTCSIDNHSCTAVDIDGK
jgi:hypothetical protein